MITAKRKPGIQHLGLFFGGGVMKLVITWMASV